MINKAKTTNKGFTIIELLVVIAIIGLLSSIVLVSMRGSTGKARIAKSLEFSQTMINTIGVDAVGIWSFDEGAYNTCPGGTADVCDKSGYGNHGTITGATFVSGEENTPHWYVNEGEGRSALKLDGNDCVTCGNRSSLRVASGDMTVEAWINLASLGKYHTIMAKWTPWIFFVYRTNNRLMFYTRQGGGDRSVYANTALSANRWYHAVAIYTRSDHKVQFYLNGKNDGLKTLPGVMNGDGGASANIGCYTAGNRFDGKIDEVRIYARALGSAEIQQHYADGAEKHNLALK